MKAFLIGPISRRRLNIHPNDFPYFEDLAALGRHPAAVVDRTRVLRPRQAPGVQLVEGLDDARDSNPRPVGRVVADDQHAVRFPVVRIVHLMD